MKVIKSYNGDCSPVWLNTNQIHNRLDNGITGFFKRVKKGWFGFTYRYGNEFYGIIKNGAVHRHS